MKLVQSTHGGLTTRTVASDAAPEGVVVLCHGYGAPGTDLVGLAPEMIAQRPELERVHFVFPEAPDAIDPQFGGRAWWPIDMARLQAAMMSGETRAMKDEFPEGMGSARKKLRALVDELMRDTGLTLDQFVLGGFSQGAMLSIDLTLSLEEAPAGLLIFSGALLKQSEWKERAKRRAGLKVLQTHGRQDPILGFAQSEDLKALLEEAGLEVDFDPFDGPHTISASGLSKGADFIVDRLLA